MSGKHHKDFTKLVLESEFLFSVLQPTVQQLLKKNSKFSHFRSWNLTETPIRIVADHFLSVSDRWIDWWIPAARVCAVRSGHTCVFGLYFLPVHRRTARCESEVQPQDLKTQYFHVWSRITIWIIFIELFLRHKTDRGSVCEPRARQLCSKLL